MSVQPEYFGGTPTSPTGYRKPSKSILQSILDDAKQSPIYKAGEIGLRGLGEVISVVSDATSFQSGIAGLSAGERARAAGASNETVTEVQEEAKTLAQKKQLDANAGLGIGPVGVALGAAERTWSYGVARPASTAALVTDPDSPLYTGDSFINEQGDKVDLKPGFQWDDIRNSWNRSEEVSFGQAAVANNLVSMTPGVGYLYTLGGINSYDPWSEYDMTQAQENPYYRFITGATDFSLEVAVPPVAKLGRLKAIDRLGLRSTIKSADDIAVMRSDYDYHRTWLETQGTEGHKTTFGEWVDVITEETNPVRLRQYAPVANANGVDKFTLSQILSKTNDRDTVANLLLANSGDFTAMRALAERAPDHVWALSDMNNVLRDGYVNGDTFMPTGNALIRTNQIFDSAVNRDDYFRQVRNLFATADEAEFKVRGPGSTWMPSQKFTVERIRRGKNKFTYAVKSGDYSDTARWSQRVAESTPGGPVTVFLQWAGSRQPLGYVSKSGARPDDIWDELTSQLDAVPLFRGNRPVVVGAENVDGEVVPVTLPASTYRNQLITELSDASNGGNLMGAYRAMEDNLVDNMADSVGVPRNLARQFAAGFRNKADESVAYMRESGGYVFDEKGSRVWVDPISQRQMLNSFPTLPLDEIYNGLRDEVSLIAKYGGGSAEVLTEVFDAGMKFFRTNVLFRPGYTGKNSALEPMLSSWIAHGTILTDEGLAATLGNFVSNRANLGKRAAYMMELDTYFKRVVKGENVKTRRQLRNELRELARQRNDVEGVIDDLLIELDNLKSGKLSIARAREVEPELRERLVDAQLRLEAIEAALDGKAPEWRQIVEPARLSVVREKLQTYREIIEKGETLKTGKLTDEAREVLDQYVHGTLFYQVNDYLRYLPEREARRANLPEGATVGDPVMDYTIPLLDEATYANVATDSFQVFRGQNMTPDTIPTSGQTVSYREYLSTSRREDVARNWTDGGVDAATDPDMIVGASAATPMGTTPVWFTIDIPRGSRFADVSKQGIRQNQEEILLPRDSSFFVSRVEDVFDPDTGELIGRQVFAELQQEAIKEQIDFNKFSRMVDELQEQYDELIARKDTDFSDPARELEKLQKNLDIIDNKTTAAQVALGAKRETIGEVSGMRGYRGSGQGYMSVRVGGEKIQVPAAFSDREFDFGSGYRAEASAATTNRLTYDPSFRAEYEMSRWQRTGQITEIRPNDPAYWDELAFVANRYFRDDRLIQRILRGDSRSDIAAWLRSTEGVSYQKSMGKQYLVPKEKYQKPVTAIPEIDPQTGKVPERSVLDRVLKAKPRTGRNVILESTTELDEVYRIVDQYFPDREVRDLIATREVTPGELQRRMAALPNLSRITGEDLLYIPGSRAAVAYRGMNRFLDRIWQFIATMPEDRIARWPFYQREFKYQMERRANILSGQGVKMDEKQFDAMRQASHRAALTELEKTFYNIRRYNTPVYTSRFLLSFPGAFFNSIYRYGRFAAKEPERLFQTGLFANDILMNLAVDVDGNPVDSPEKAEYIIIPGTKRNMTDTGVRIPVASFATLTVNAPALSYAATMLVSEITKRNPKTEEILQENLGPAYEEIFPYGIPDNPLSGLFGSYQKDLWRAAQGEKDEDFITAAVQIYADDVALWEKNGGQGEEPSFNEAIEKTRDFFLSRGGNKFVNAFTVNQRVPGQLMRDAWYKIRNEYPGNTQEARKVFLEQYGDWARWYTYSSSQYEAYLPSTQDAYERVWVQHPELTRKIVSQTQDDLSFVTLMALGTTGDYSPAVGNFMRSNALPGDDRPVISRMPIEQFDNMVKTSDGWAVYNREKIKFDAEIARLREVRDTAQTEEAKDNARALIKANEDSWRQWVADYEDINRAWGFDRNSGVGNKPKNAAMVLNTMLEDKKFASTEGKKPLWKNIRTFLDSRDKALEAVRESSSSELKKEQKLSFVKWVTETLLLESPEFTEAWERFFAREWAVE